MSKQELQDRLNKQLEKKVKIERLLNKYGTLLNEEEKQDMNNLTWKELRVKYGAWLDNRLDDYRRKICELKELLETINNTQTRLNKLINFENEDKIEVLVKFLNDWKEKAYIWYIENAKYYIELKKNEEQALSKAKEDENFYKKFGSGYYLTSFEYHTECNWKKYYYSNVTTLTKEIVGYRNSIDTEKLNKVLEDEKNRKYKDLVSRITKIVGTIEDVSNLSIGDKNGEINGLVKGSKATAKVNTISAGGYNEGIIVNEKHGQCFHYRVLIHEVK